MAVDYQDVRVLEVLSSATTRMAEGEVMQLVHSDDLELSEKEYLEVIIRKTAVLISAACQTGAIFGKADSIREEALRSYGHHLGIAFQLIDDALDYTGDSKELGKPVGNDLQEGKATLPLIHAMRSSSPSGQRRLRDLFSAELLRPEDIEEIRQIVHLAGGIEYTQQKAFEHVHTAKEALEVFAAHPTRDVLVDLADYVICRRV
jgi:octaprenyl-diphosphate synthase